ncbi:MAG: hypothetical protein AB1540_02670 [Bdellovibrionota bacterium]
MLKFKFLLFVFWGLVLSFPGFASPAGGPFLDIPKDMVGRIGGAAGLDTEGNLGGLGQLSIGRTFTSYFDLTAGGIEGNLLMRGLLYGKVFPITDKPSSAWTGETGKWPEQYSPAELYQELLEPALFFNLVQVGVNTLGSVRTSAIEFGFGAVNSDKGANEANYGKAGFLIQPLAVDFEDSTGFARAAPGAALVVEQGWEILRLKLLAEAALTSPASVDPSYSYVNSGSMPVVLPDGSQGMADVTLRRLDSEGFRQEKWEPMFNGLAEFRVQFIRGAYVGLLGIFSAKSLNVVQTTGEKVGEEMDFSDRRWAVFLLAGFGN